MGSVSEGRGHRSPGVLDVDPASSRVVPDLSHPHLAVMKSVPDGVEPELASGCSLAELARSTELPLRISLRILLDVLSGIAAIHHAKLDGRRIGFVHGEVAPANIIVGRDGTARLVPIARATGRGDANLAGYQAPELLLGDAVDQTADVFSAGVLLWEAISGTRLFPDGSADAIVIQLIGGKVLPPPAPRDAPWAEELGEVAMRAINVDPTLRWPHVGALGATIENIAHIYLATPAELAAFVTRATGGTSRGSFPDEATTQRRAVPDSPTMHAPESLAAVSTPVFPESGPSLAGPGAIAPPESQPVPLVSRRPPPSPELLESMGGPTVSPGMSPRRRKIIVSGVLAASVVLVLVAVASKVHRTDSGETRLPAPELARAAAATPPVHDLPPPLPPPTAVATVAPAVVPASEPVLPASSTPAKPTHPAGKAAPPSVSPAPQPRLQPPAPAQPLPPAAQPAVVRPAPTAPPVQKPRPAADQFGI